MKTLLSPYLLIMLAAAVICTFIAGYVWFRRRRGNSETIPLLLMLALIVEWIVAALLGLVDPNLTHKILWAKLEYIGVVNVPLAVLVYVIYHSGLNRQWPFKRLVWLALIPAITLVLAWTNEYHGLIWARYIPYQASGLTLSDKTYGAWFWVYWAYSYLILLAATVLTIRVIRVPARLFRWQSILVLIGILAPWAANLLHVLHIQPFMNLDLDLTPLALGITGIALAVGMFRWELFDIKPIAYSAVIAGMADGVIILDNQERIIEVNAGAPVILGLKAQEMVGKPMEQAVANRLPLGERANRMREKSIAIKLTFSREGRQYELSDSPFYEKSGAIGGRIIFLHDATERKRLEEKLTETEHKQAELTLRESEDKFQYVFENSSVGKSFTQPTGEVQVNKAFCELLGYSAEELHHKKWPEFTHPDDIELTQREVDTLLAGEKEATRFTKRFLRKDGAVVWTDVSSSLRRDPQGGKPLYIMTTMIDITEQKHTEEMLRQSEEKFRQLSERSMVGICVFQGAKMPYVNPCFAAMFGYAPEEIIDKLDPATLIHPDDFQPILRRIQGRLQGQDETKDLVYRGIKKDGTLIYIEGNGVKIDFQGQPAVMGTLIDITERKRVEAQQENFYKTLNASLNELYIFDAETLHFEFVSAGALRNLGYTLDELHGMTPLDLKPAFTSASFNDLIAPLRQHKASTIDFETLHRRVDGSTYPVEVHLQLFDRTEHPTFLAVVLDISEQKRMKDELQQTLAELKRSNTELEQFAYVASHDLQEPLRMVSSYLQLIERRYKGKLDQDANEFIDFAVDGAGRMQRMINDLLLYSRVGTRGKPFAPISCELALKQALDNLKVTIQENNALVTHDPLPTVMADESQLVQLFQNLTGNAIKFSKKPDVTDVGQAFSLSGQADASGQAKHPVRVQGLPYISPQVHISAVDEGQEWVFAVRDNGIGIDPQYAERIFVIFQRLHDHSQYPGTGIGLAMCKKIVLRHGGRIWVESRPGEGATFFFTLPK